MGQDIIEILERVNKWMTPTEITEIVINSGMNNVSRRNISVACTKLYRHGESKRRYRKQSKIGGKEYEYKYIK